MVLIANLAEAFEASVITSSSASLTVAVRVLRADGAIAPYTLLIEATGRTVKARESAPDRLPGACPNRHINLNGTFCTHWDTVHPLEIVDVESADRWWKQLLAYLRLQERAAYLRRWPGRAEWAHGDAAKHQWRVEVCASALNDDFYEAAKAGRLKIKQSKNAPNFLAVMDGKRRLYSVWKKERRVATLRQRCFCGSALALKSCANHADLGAELAFELLKWDKEEQRFWDSLRGQKCCGSLDNCPLADIRASSVTALQR